MNGVDFSINLIDNFSQTLKKVDEKFKGSFKRMSDQVKGLSSQFSGMQTAIAGIGVAAFTKKIIEATTNVEKMQIKLAQTFDKDFGAGYGSMLYEEIRKVQESSEISRNTFIEYANQMKFVEAKGGDLVDVMRQMSDISRGNEGNFATLGTALNKLSQDYAYSEKMQNQFISMGFNPLLEISKKTGESIDSLKVKLKDGAIGYDQIRAAMRSATSEGGDFANLSEKISATFGERLNSQIARFPDILAKMGGSLSKRLDPVLRSIEKFTDKIMDGKINLTLFTNVLSNFTVVGLGAVAAMKAFNFVAQMNPFVRIASGVLLLGSYLAEVVNWGTRFKEIFENFGSGKTSAGLVSIGKLISEVITKPILALLDLLTSIIPGNFGEKINAGVKKLIDFNDKRFGNIPAQEEEKVKTRSDFVFKPKPPIGGGLLKDLEEFDAGVGKNKITGGNITSNNITIHSLVGLAVTNMESREIDENKIGAAMTNVLVREVAQFRGV